jgi:deazaflavin-dependent oxidoreductase (nitroreductase family)
MTSMPEDMKAHNAALIEEFRANGGLGERPVLLLSTTGARSGQRRTTPVMFLRIDGHLVVVASNAGAERDPDWFHNLVADPDVTIELGGQDGVETYDTKATVPQGEERDALFAKVTEAAPFFADHQAGIERRIPVVVVDRL